MRRTFPKSEALFEQARAVTPGGAQTGSKAPGRVGPLGAFPLYLSHGAGPYVIDVDGHKYVDWFNGNCAVTLGHADGDVTRAALLACQRGVLLSLPSPLESSVAERLVDRIPCAEQIRFVKTGSEACAAAVRIARMATGRTKIAVCEGQYHGWHDWSVVRNAYHPGIPDAMRDLIVTFKYNDLRSLEQVLTEDVAAVMLEPTLTVAPDPGFLEVLVDLAHARGALVIFDEMITGARWAIGGAQEYFRVTPDLSTHGKSYANGYPLAFVAGPADLMQHAWPISGTFGGDLVSLAACKAVLSEYTSRGAIARMWEVGQRLIDTVNGITVRLGLPARMIGYPCRPVLEWHVAGKPDLQALVVALFQQELAQAGILAHPSGWNPSAAHDSIALEQTLAGVHRALTEVGAAIDHNDVQERLRGEPIRPAFVRQPVSA